MEKEWKDWTETELIEEAQRGAQGQGATIEMLRRIALVAQQKTTTRLTWVIGICTFLLLIAAYAQIYLTWLIVFPPK